MLQNRDMSEDNGAAVRASHVQHRARPPRPPSLVSKSLKMMLLDGHHLQAKGSCSGNAVLSHSTRGDAPHSVKGIQDRLPADSGKPWWVSIGVHRPVAPETTKTHTLSRIMFWASKVGETIWKTIIFVSRITLGFLELATDAGQRKFPQTSFA